MTLDTFEKLKQEISANKHLPAKKQQDLLRLVDELKMELETAHNPSNAKNQEREEWLKKLEVEYPQTVNITNRIMVMLSNMGI